MRTANKQGYLVPDFDTGALQEGVYDGNITIGELKKYGDFAIGTFDGLEGEMIELKGAFYQVKADGKVYTVADSITTLLKLNCCVLHTLIQGPHEEAIY